MNNTKQYVASQDFFNNFSDKVYPTPEIALKGSKAFIELSRGLVNALAYLLQAAHHFPVLYPSQALLANYSGYYSRRHMNRILNELERLGFLISYYIHRYTKIYILSAYFL